MDRYILVFFFFFSSSLFVYRFHKRIGSSISNRRRKKQQNTSRWDVTWCTMPILVYKNKRTHLERNRRAIKRNKCHWYRFPFHRICFNLFLATSNTCIQISDCYLFFFFSNQKTSILYYWFSKLLYWGNVIRENFPVETRTNIYPWCLARFLSLFFSVDLFRQV